MRSFRILIAALAFAGLGVHAANAETKSHRLALQVSDNAAEKMNAVLNVASNVSRYYSERGEEVEIEIVAFNEGLHMLREDTSPVKERIKNFAASMPNVRFAACKNTMDSMEKKEGRPIAILPNASVVIAGVTRLIELSEDGWTIVRP
ncbi:MAG: DsrE family protein [Xanthobacteraceae bacterium]|jgi:intracellular sulfur oxidation DsrE/DsrF family protein